MSSAALTNTVIDRSASGAAAGTKILPGSDAVRAIACLWVFLHHLYQQNHTTDTPASLAGRFMLHGDYGVPMFFVLSGFLLSIPFWAALKQGRPLPSLRTYAWRRGARIVPGYYVNLIALALITGHLASVTDLRALVAALAFFHPFSPATVLLPFNAVLWTIGTEAVFYALLALLVVATFRRGDASRIRFVVAATIAVLLAGQVWLTSVHHPVGDAVAEWWVTYRNPFILFVHFLVGVVAADVHTSLARVADPPRALKRRRWSVFDTVLVTASVGAIAIATFDFVQVAQLPGVWRLLGVWRALNPAVAQYSWPTFPVLIGAVLVTAPRAHLLARWTQIKPLEITAKLSFGIYLWHVPVLTFVSALLAQASLSGPAHVAVAGVTALLATYLIAAVSYYAIEQPALTAARRVESSPARGA